MNGISIAVTLLFAALPATNNYKLNSYNFGSGGTAGSSTTTYSLEGGTGELSGSTSTTSNNQFKPGFIEVANANVPKVATLDNNNGEYYNKLHMVIDPQGNPSDAKFLVAVSTDNFVSDIKYLQPDGTLSSTLDTDDYQTYSEWGSSSGSLILGLNPATTYYVHIKATQGKFTESAYGPTASQATAPATLTFGLSTSNSSTPPYTVSLGTLTAGVINTADQTINTSLSTNAASGGDIYIKGKNGGLLSSSTGNKIEALSADLASITDGFGAQNNSVGQTSGGPFVVKSPYEVSGNSVAIVDATTRSLYSSSAPIIGGIGVLVLKGKSTTTDVAATDYQEVLTFLAAGNF